MTHFARLATSQDIQAELMADDIDIDFDKMSLWTREEAENFFVTGEEPKPPWQPEPYLMGELDKCNLGHLKEVLGQEKHGELGTIGGLVNLMRTDRPKFLPTLKDLGVAKLPDRQALRDLINEIANPPKGSEHDLREVYKAELATYPWGVVQGEKFITESEVECMVSRLPEKGLKTYRVTIRTKGVSSVPVRRRRAASSGVVMSAFPEVSGRATARPLSTRLPLPSTGRRAHVSRCH